MKKIHITIIISLLLGLIIGFSSARLLTKKRFEKRRHPKHRIERLLRHLDINQEQKELLNPNLEKFQIKAYQMRQKHKSEIQQLTDSLLAVIKPVLDEEQLIKLEKIKLRHKKRLKSME